MNPKDLMMIMSSWEIFKNNHPKFPAFIKALTNQGIVEDTIIEISVTDPSGNKIETNIKVKESDLEILNNIRNMR